MADLLMKMPVPYEPKKKNRFILRFDSSLGINEWYVESTSRPQVTINSVEVPFLNTSTYVAGRFTWGTDFRNIQRPNRTIRCTSTYGVGKNAF